MSPITQNFITLAIGVLVLAGLVYIGGPGHPRSQCQKLLEDYNRSGTVPARGDPERARYVNCYEMMCGIKLD